VRREVFLAALILAAVTAPASAQGPVVIDVDGSDAALAGTGLSVPLDSDDDDDDGVADAEQAANVPMEDLRRLRVRGRRAVEIRASQGLRLVRDGRPISNTVTFAPAALPVVIGVQGTEASRAARDRSLTLVVDGAETRIPVTVASVAFLGADNVRLDPTEDAAGVSHAITNDATLAREYSYEAPSADPDDLRVEIHDPSVEGLEMRAILSSGPVGERPRARRELTLQRPRLDAPFRSGFVRLVGDVMDQEAPGVSGRVLRVALRDDLSVAYETGDGSVSTSLRVGRNGREDGPQAARRARLRVRVLRHRRGGVPAIGDNDQGAVRIAREQVRIANEI